MNFARVWRSAFIAFAILASVATGSRADEPKIVVQGSVDAAIAFWNDANFWGEEERGNDLIVPRVLVIAINKTWKQEAEQITVAVKKELFYRGLVPLILYANEAIARERKRLESLTERHQLGQALGAEDRAWLNALAVKYRLLDAESEADALSDQEIRPLMEKLLLRVDVIPPALALGQGAYESGYGTSRFTLLGNALFGQWTYGGKGIKPKGQRKSKGDYKVAAFDWPLESVKAYMTNLNTHRTYEDLRLKRAALRSQGAKLTGLALAGTLTKYSEEGQTYVDTLKGIIKTNKLDIADSARLRDEPPTLIVAVDTEEEVAEMHHEIAQLRASGELARIIESMGLEAD